MIDRPRTASSDRAWPVLSEQGNFSVAELCGFIRKSARLITVVSLAVLALAAAYLLITPARYVATAQLMIGPPREPLFQSTLSNPDVTIDTAQVESEIQVLRSATIAHAVIDELQLLKDPEFQESGTDPMRVATAKFEDRLSAYRVGESYVIELTFSADRAGKAARIANAVAKAYIDEQIAVRAGRAHQASRWLQQRILELGGQLNAAARAVQQFKLQNGLVAGNGQADQQLIVDQLTELEARAEAYRKLYQSYLQKFTDTVQQESFQLADARIVTAAAKPLAKSYPKTRLVLMLALLVGLLAGAAIAGIRHKLDHTIRRWRQVRQWIGVDCLGELAWYANSRDPPRSRYIETIEAPFSSFSKALSGVKVSLDIAYRANGNRAIGLCSLLPGAGTSTLAINLAALSAMSGAKTLLIDGDITDPMISRTMVPHARVGLFEMLNGRDDAIILDPKTNVHVLPLIRRDAVANFCDLLGSLTMQELLARLHAVFHTIIVDLPALTVAVDARALGSQLDGCVLVAEWGRTPLDDLKDASDLFRASQVHLLGVVINKARDVPGSISSWDRLRALPRPQVLAGTRSLVALPFLSSWRRLGDRLNGMLTNRIRQVCMRKSRSASVSFSSPPVSKSSGRPRSP